jgi:SAM-dependent methyltransferase
VARYTQQDNPAFEAELAQRSPHRHAAFFTRHLRRGMRVLDVGCGPGSITAGLADVVAPAPVIGIDIQPALIARAQAAAHGRANLRFEVADLHRLPFVDASFDAVFANGVLMHLSEPMRALAEMQRVLRPGGIVGVRDPDFATALHAPLTEVLERWLTLRARVRRFNGGDPCCGRHYRRWLLEAGFVHARASASIDFAGTHEQTRRQAVFLKAQLRGVARTAIEQGWIDAPAVRTAMTEIDAWSQRPDAFCAMTWCEAIAWRPPLP